MEMHYVQSESELAEVHEKAYQLQQETARLELKIDYWRSGWIGRTISERRFLLPSRKKPLTRYPKKTGFQCYSFAFLFCYFC